MKNISVSVLYRYNIKSHDTSADRDTTWNIIHINAIYSIYDIFIVVLMKKCLICISELKTTFVMCSMTVSKLTKNVLLGL